jgi:acetylglutamate kinase
MSSLLPLLLHWLHEYGYPMLWLIVFVAAVGLPLPTNLILLAAGAFAGHGDFQLALLIGITITASSCGDNVGYFSGMVHAHIADERLGFVGEIDRVDATPVRNLIEAGYIPIVAPLGAAPDGTCLNINADLVASHLAGALDADKLLFLSNVPGICHSNGKVISEVTEAQARWLIEDGVITGGMLPKVQACLDALASVPCVHILDGREPHALRQGLFTKQVAGTMVVR